MQPLFRNQKRTALPAQPGAFIVYDDADRPTYIGHSSRSLYQTIGQYYSRVDNKEWRAYLRRGQFRYFPVQTRAQANILKRNLIEYYLDRGTHLENRYKYQESPDALEEHREMRQRAKDDAKAWRSARQQGRVYDPNPDPSTAAEILLNGK